MKKVICLTDGYVKEELPEYSVDGPVKMYSSPYTVIYAVMTGKLKKEVILDKNSQVQLQMKK